MAINYSPVGWDPTKFFGPTNMNHMDDGIKAACDGVDAANKSLENLDKSTKSAQYGSCNNTDLNTIKTPGIYFCDSSSKASTDNNFPDAIKGYLIVYAASESAVQQIYYANKNYVYTRTYWDGGWGSWNKQALNSDLDKQLSEKKIFFGLDSVGMALTNTLQEVYNAMPDNSMLKVYVSNGSESVVFQQSLPVYSAGEVIIYRGTSARGYIQFLQDNNGDMWRNNYYNSALQGWDKFVLNSDLAEQATLKVNRQQGIDVDNLVSQNEFSIYECNDYCSNLPVSKKYSFIMSVNGLDAKFGAQLGLGMTTHGLFYRRKNAGTYTDWDSVAMKSDLLFYPDVSNVVAELNTAGQSYTVDQSGYVIGTINGDINGWANIRNSKNMNYFLALSGDTNVPTAVCIPFKKGDTVVLGTSGTYNLAFVGAK